MDNVYKQIKEAYKELEDLLKELIIINQEQPEVEEQPILYIDDYNYSEEPVKEDNPKKVIKIDMC